MSKTAPATLTSATEPATPELRTQPPPLNPQQRLALETRTVSVALSAGAGCGKTFVLTERYLSHLEPPAARRSAEKGSVVETVELHNLVAITFTDRAAREMRERIRSKARERLLTADEADAAHWLDLTRNLDGARISTFHSLCANLLRSHAVEARLDPGFVTLEEAEAGTLLVEAIDDVLRQALTDSDEDAIELAMHYGLNSLKTRIGDMLAACRGQKLSAWLEMVPEELAAVWRRLYETEFRPRFGAYFAQHPLLRELRELVLNWDRDAVDANVIEHCRVLLALTEQCAAAADPAGMLQEIRGYAKVSGGKLNIAKKAFAAPEDQQRLKVIFERLRKEIDRYSALLTFDSAASLPVAELALRLLRLSDRALAAYTAAKTTVNGLDFTDLQLRARDLLNDPQFVELQQRLRSQIRLLLVDECQDTDQVQIEIIRALLGEGAEGKLFFVGDYKQSIYRFRGADPRLFQEMRQSIPAAGRLPLSQNFRSQPAVLQFVNALFCEQLGTAAEAYEPLIPHRAALATAPAVEFLWMAEDSSTSVTATAENGATANDAVAESKPAAAKAEKAEKKPKRGAKAASDAKQASPKPPKLTKQELLRREARWIAARLRQLLDSGTVQVWDKAAKIQRELRYGDIAILFKALADSQEFETALREQGIPYYVVGGHAFYNQQEVYDLLNLLRAIHSPTDEVALAGALRSPIFGVSDESLFWLARKEGSLAAGLRGKSIPEQLKRDQSARVAHAANVLTELRREKDRLPIADLINRALELTGYDAALLAEFLGERKLANLRKLIDQARAFDRSGRMGLDDYLIRLSEFVVNEPKEALAATHPEETDVVKIMTIHKSKGLEFPLVTVPNLERRNRGDQTSTQFDPVWGPLVSLSKDETESAGEYDQQNDEEQNDGALPLWKLLSKWSGQDETYRLFYVALTRAADYLLLSAGFDDRAKIAQPSNPWLKLLAERFDPLTGVLLARLPPGYAAPQVTVTLAKPKVDKPRPKETSLSVNALLDKLASHQPTAADHVALAEELTRIAPLAPDKQSRRRFSVSRLTGALRELHLDPLAAAEYDVTSTSPVTARGQDEYVVFPPLSSIPGIELATDPLELGNLAHDVLARLTPERLRAGAAARLSEWVERSAAAWELDEPRLMTSAQELVAKFLRSPRAKQLASAKEFRTEVEFLLPCSLTAPAATTAPKIAATSNTGSKLPVPPSVNARTLEQPSYLQGFLDLLYQDEAGGWWVLDYKTSRVTAANRAATVQQYEPQMLVYALAVEQALGRPPAGMILHFLRTGEEEVFIWNAAAKARAFAWLNTALATVQREIL